MCCGATCAVPDIAFDKFEEKFVPPDLQEGFRDVIKWEFAVGPKVRRFLCALALSFAPALNRVGL